MLQIAANRDVSTLHIKYNIGKKIDICQAAAIQLKNMAEVHWWFWSHEHAKEILADYDFKYILIEEEEKEFIRENLMLVLAALPRGLVFKQIA